MLFVLGACQQDTNLATQKSDFLDKVNWDELKQVDAEDARKDLIRLSVDYGFELNKTLRDTNFPIIAGYINREFLKELKALPPETSTIIIYSTGGLGDIALDAAELIRSRGWTVIIFGSCNSACAEYVLPAAKKVVFFDDPLVGFHGNMSSMRYFVLKDELKNPCAPTSDENKMIQKLDAQIARGEALYSETGHNMEFWKEQIERLGSAKLVTTSMGDEGCVYIQQFPFEIWYPTSEQLTSLFGLKFEGTLCADDVICYNRKIPLFKGVGEKYVVGNTEYLSQLP